VSWPRIVTAAKTSIILGYNIKYLFIKSIIERIVSAEYKASLKSKNSNQLMVKGSEPGAV
jgi:predicted transcriptional regulator